MNKYFPKRVIPDKNKIPCKTQGNNLTNFNHHNNLQV